MISALRRVANAVLFVVACLLAADTANAVFAAIVLPPRAQDAEAKAAEPEAAPTLDRQAILDRNVFASSTLAPTAPTQSDIDKDLEATQLPLTLLGTAASQDPRLAWAAIQERGSKATLIVSINDTILDKATVVKIERQRVVLLEDGVHRELALEETDLAPKVASAAPPAAAAAGPGARRATAMARAAERRQARLQKLSDNNYQVPSEDVQAVMNNPADLLSQARILPKFENGQMQGLQISQIKPGSLYEQLGMQEGDMVTTINGNPINAPDQAAAAMNAFASGTVTVEGVGANNQPFTRTLQQGAPAQ
ncbi:MAG TPA: type II secretion system protein GspC [Myxococcota bacterium]|nr:type II secretion system protein GspC [Myxococcota bacterium]